jgi:S1-C subfamily serine protease
MRSTPLADLPARWSRSLRLILGLGLSVALPAAARAEDAAPESIQRWLESVVLLQAGPAWCSGVIIDDRGTVATAYHCVASGLRPLVRTRSGEETVGRILALDAEHDLALVTAPELTGKVQPRPIRTEPALQGERVYGMGHPFAPAADRNEAMTGVLLWSVSEGIVSAVGAGLIQTDAALNPGNSGGPVLDAQGRLIGITSRKLQGDNISFLVPTSWLSAMIADPKRPLFGGEWFGGLSMVSGLDLYSVPTGMLRGGALVRDRLRFSVAAGLPADARGVAMERGFAWYPQAEGTLGLHQHFGRGVWATSLEVGGGAWLLGGVAGSYDPDRGTWDLWPTASAVEPGVYGRVGLGGVGLRLIDLPGLGESGMLLGLDLDIPGTIATF